MGYDKSFFNKTKFSFFKSRIENDIFSNLKSEMQNSEFAKTYSAHEEEIKADLMEKYFKYDYRQMQLLLNDVEKQQLMSEVNETLNEMGIKDKSEKEEITEDMIEEKAKGKNSNSKETMQEKILLASAKKRTKEFGREIIKQKEGHIDDKTIAFSEKEAVKDIADAKVLKQIQNKYKKITKKDLSKNKEIKKEEKKIQNKTEGIQKGEDIRVRHEIRMREKIEKELQVEKRKLAEAIKNHDPKSKQYKENVEELEDKLVNLKKGQTDFDKEMYQQEKNEELADKAKIGKYDPFSDKSNLDGKKHNDLSDSFTADEIKKDKEKNEREQEKTHDREKSYEKELKGKEEYDTLNRLETNSELGSNVQAHIDDSKVNGQRYDRKMHDVQMRRDEVNKENYKQVHEIEQEHYEKNSRADNEFLSDLRAGVNDINKNPEDFIMSDKRREEQMKNDKDRDNQYKKEAEQNRKDAERVRRTSKKNNNYNN